MKIHFSKSNQILQTKGRSMAAWCKVRNELNGQRRIDEVVLTEPDPYPYYPRRFPVGTWNVFRPIAKTSSYLSPFFIPTDAWQMVDVWSIKDSKYLKKTGAQYKDQGYGIHFSTSGTTLGCIRIGSVHDLLWLVEEINKALDEKQSVIIEVVE